MDDYHIKVNMGTFTLPELFEEVKRFIHLEGCNYDVSEAGREFRAQYRALTNPAKIIQKFLLYNVIPSRKDSLHVSFWNFCLPTNAIRPLQCSNNIPKMYASYILRSD